VANPKGPATGRQSIFRDKIGGDRVQGVITPAGSRRFEIARSKLAKLAGREVEQVSDADVIEFLARGEANTREYLAGSAS
jgi:hypothetical protein